MRADSASIPLLECFPHPPPFIVFRPEPKIGASTKFLTSRNAERQTAGRAHPLSVDLRFHLSIALQLCLLDAAEAQGTCVSSDDILHLLLK
jgi:hypothetical protein